VDFIYSLFLRTEGKIQTALDSSDAVRKQERGNKKEGQEIDG
jgi:hypothetical protein